MKLDTTTLLTILPQLDEIEMLISFCLDTLEVSSEQAKLFILELLEDLTEDTEEGKERRKLLHGYIDKIKFMQAFEAESDCA